MNKTELIDAIAEKSRLSKVDSRKALEAVVESITEEMKKGGKVMLIGFGTFSVKDRAARAGINPKTKAVLAIPAKKSVRFKAGSDLSGCLVLKLVYSFC